MADAKRIATNCGIVAPIVALGAIVLSTVVAPPETFTWQDRALSEMGRYGAPTFAPFNGGLIVAGSIGLPFVWRLWLASRNALERLGTLALALAVAGTIGVGVFFLDHTAVYLETSLHGVAALAVFGVAPFASWLYGSGAALSGDGRLAVASFWLGIVHPVAWLAWLVAPGGAAGGGAWFAVPEFVAVAALGGWIFLLAVVLRRRDGATNASVR